MRTCHHCGGRYKLVLVKRDRLVKQCLDCGKQWNEPNPEPLIRPGGWVWRHPR